MGGAWGRRGVLARERLTLWGEPVGVGSQGGSQEKAGHAQIKIQCPSAYVSKLALVHVVCAGSGDSQDFQGVLLAR